MKKMLLMPTSILMFVIVSCQKTPEASISANKTTVETEENITFANSTTNANSYVWDFGDGSQSTEQAPAKNYTASGTYAVKMTAYSKNKKKIDVAKYSITVNDVNKKFVGNYGMNGSCSGNAPYVMNVTATGSKTIILNNFVNAQLGWNLNATVSGKNFTIPMQTFYGPDEYYEISGTGSLDVNYLTINVTIIDHDYNGNFANENCNDSGNKQ